MNRKPSTLLDLYKHTLLANIECLEDILFKMVAFAERNETSLATIIVDIVNLRNINKELGFMIGNEIMLDLAESISLSIRKSDIAGKYEGSSFLVILSNTDSFGALKVEERIRENFIKIRSNKFVPKLNTVIGSYPENALEGEKLLDLLLDGLSFAKKNNIETYLVPQSSQEKLPFLGSNFLLKALKEERIFPAFQSIFSIKGSDLELYGHELLMRIKTPNGELIPAFKFIEKLKKSSMIYIFEEIIINKALKAKKQNQLEGKLFINMPLRFLEIIKRDESRLNYILEDIMSYGFSPKDIFIEISEKKERAEPKKLDEFANILRQKGFSLALDDFGVENSSIEKLNDVKPDIVKLDMFFLKEGRDMIEWVSQGLKDMGYKVLLEGLETKEDLELAKSLEIDYVQGFYVGKPFLLE